MSNTYRVAILTFQFYWNFFFMIFLFIFVVYWRRYYTYIKKRQFDLFTEVWSLLCADVCVCVRVLQTRRHCGVAATVCRPAPAPRSTRSDPRPDTAISTVRCGPRALPSAETCLIITCPTRERETKALIFNAYTINRWVNVFMAHLGFSGYRSP